MKIWDTIIGSCEVEMTSANLLGALGELADQNVRIRTLTFSGALTAVFRVSQRDRTKVERLCAKRGYGCRILASFSIWKTLNRMQKRPILVIGLLLIVLVSAFLPSRILFVAVEGNQRIPSRRIQEAAELAGLGFGTVRRSIRSEKIKNTLIDEIPELQWAGVNTYGCRAVISVKENSLPESRHPVRNPVSSIIAELDGIIESCTASSGTLLCVPGQAVRKGEILISGYTDCGAAIRAEAAQGEIYAKTDRHLTAVTPGVFRALRTVGEKKRCISLLLGKKRINLWKDSGIWDSTCGRMYMEQYVTFPGGYVLPVGISWEERTERQFSDAFASPKSMQETLSMAAEREIFQRAIAGKILQQQESFEQTEQVYCLTGQYICLEMIGRVHTEQIGEYHGEAN